MAGYSMASPISPNHSQRKLLKQNRFRNDNIDRFSIVHPLNSKVIKSKYKTKVSVMSSEREEYIKKFLNIHINDKIKTPKNDHKFAVFHNSHEKVPISKYEKLFTRQSPEIPHTSLLDIVKSKGLTTFNVPTNVSDSIENKFDKSCRLQDQNSPKNHDYPKIISRVNREENWLLPEESTQFKKVMENNFEMIYKNKHNKIIDTHVNNIRENHFTEKVNLLSLIKSDRKKISLSMRVKGFFSSFPTLNLKSSLRKYIPYKFLDVDDNLKVPGKEEFVEFTEEMEKEILTILRSQNQLIVTAFSINIHTKDLITLCGTNWLNDSVIEFYLNLITLRSQSSVYAFGTFFFPRLSKGNNLGRWANKLDFFSYDILLVPIHHNSHWRLAIVDNKRKRIEYYDSLGIEFPQCVDLLAKFLQTESINKKKTPLDISQWDLVYTVPGLPLQNNSYDCGVFTCKYADYIARRDPITFTQNHIPYFRKCMIYEIVHKKLLVN